MLKSFLIKAAQTQTPRKDYLLNTTSDDQLKRHTVVSASEEPEKADT